MQQFRVFNSRLFLLLIVPRLFLPAVLKPKPAGYKGFQQNRQLGKALKHSVPERYSLVNKNLEGSLASRQASLRTHEPTNLNELPSGANHKEGEPQTNPYITKTKTNTPERTGLRLLLQRARKARPEVRMSAGVASVPFSLCAACSMERGNKARNTCVWTIQTSVFVTCQIHFFIAFSRRMLCVSQLLTFLRFFSEAELI